MYLFYFSIVNAIYWMIGSVIAWDINPMNWLLMTTTFGRICLVVLELQAMVAAIKLDDEL